MAATKKILIVEDEKILGEMYQDKFIQAGLKILLGVQFVPRPMINLYRLESILKYAKPLRLTGRRRLLK